MAIMKYTKKVALISHRHHMPSIWAFLFHVMKRLPLPSKSMLFKVMVALYVPGRVTKGELLLQHLIMQIKF